MQKKFIVAGIVATVFVGAIWWANRPSPVPHIAVSPAPKQFSKSVSPPNPSPTQVSVSPAYEVPAGGDYQGLSDPRWEWWKQMRKIDPKFEWKMPIRFFGKAVDQNGKPVAGAHVLFQWTDMSASGTSEATTTTDADGRFSLNRKQGKRLGVFVSKDGYHAVNQGRGSFEYAAFFEPIYAQPKADDPVLFTLVEKHEPEPLVKIEKELKLPKVVSEASVRIDETTSLAVKLLSNEVRSGQPWEVKVSVEGGAVQTTTDEFAVEAPADGYQRSLTLTRKTPKPPSWNDLYEGGILYFKGPEKYGRIELRMMPGKEWLRATIYLNPSGSRNLEYDPAKQTSAR